MRANNKIKTLFSSLLVTLLAVVMLFTVACSGGVNKDSSNLPAGNGEAKLASLTLTGQKASFEFGEEFTVGNLAVTGKYTDDTEKTFTEEDYTVDSSAYDRFTADNYEIVVTAKNSSVHAKYTVSVNAKELLAAPTVSQGIYAYNGIPDGFNTWIINYEPGTGSDTDWPGRYQVEVFAPGDEQNKQEVGMVAAYSQIHGQQLGLSTIGMFDFNGKAVVRVRTDFAFETVDIRPLSLGIEYRRVSGLDNTIEFTLTRPCNLSVEFDGNVVKNLMLFSDYLKEYSKPADEFISDIQAAVDETQNLIVVEPGTVSLSDLYAQYSDTKQNVIVFGQGLYAMQNGSDAAGTSNYVFPSNSLVYVHGDAVIFGSHKTSDAQNITIKGRGLLSAAYGASGISNIQRVKNFVMEGVCLYQSISWTNVIWESQDVTFRNIRLCGQRRNNNDGFDMCNSSDVLIDGCFIRTIDDCITIKASFNDFNTRQHVENIIIQNTTLWNYQGGNGMIVGSESCSDSYNNISVRNMDIIHNGSNRALAMEILDSAKVTNVVFDDIRMELDNEYGANKESGNPNAPTENYVSDMGNSAPIIQFELLTNSSAYYGTDTNAGVIDGVIFNNITFNGNENRKILLKGAGANNQVKNVVVNNFVHNGTVLNDYNAGSYLQSGSTYYSNVRFSAEDLYYVPNANGVLIDDADMTFAGAEGYEITDESLTGGGYNQCSVRLTDTLTTTFNVSDEGYYMPYVNLKQGETGGLFDVAIDGTYVGNVNTYSETSQYMQYYLPMSFFAAGEHEITFTARSLPNAEFDGYMLDIGVDYVNFVHVGQNNIEFEMLSSNGTRVQDNLAGGGLAVDIALSAGQKTVFTGTTVRARGAQLFLCYQAGPDKGIYKFYYNGNLISGDIDMYSSVYGYKEVALDTVDLPLGEYTVTAECIGKNKASTGTNARLDYLHTRHLAVSKTFKAGYSGFYNGVSATGSVSITRGEWQDVALSNIQNGDVITFAGNRLGMPISGVYEYRTSVKDFDASAFDIYFAGEKVEYTYTDGIIRFVAPQVHNEGSTVRTFVCKGSGTYAFSVSKVEVVPVEMDKTTLRSLIYAEDVREFTADTDAWLIEEHAMALKEAKAILFERCSLQDEIDHAVSVLQDVVARIEDGAVRYNEATLADEVVTATIAGVADNELATLYVDAGDKQAVYYALVENGVASFTVEDTFVNVPVKLYCQVVDNPFADVSIEQGTLIDTAQAFVFCEDYYEAEKVDAFVFDSLSECNTVVASFAQGEVVENDVAMLTLRNRLNETIATVYAAIDAESKAEFVIPVVDANNVYAVVCVAGKADVKATSLTAKEVQVSNFDLGLAIVNGLEDKNVTITSSVTPNAQGVISYPLNCGWLNRTITITYNGVFDYVELDMSILRYCGSGGSDSVYIQNANGQSLAVCAATANGLLEHSYSFTYEQCGGAIRLVLWYGCKGDNGPCLADPPHGNEEIRLEGVRFYKTIGGEDSTLKLIGNNPIEVAAAKSFSATRMDTLVGVSSVTATGDFSNEERVAMVVKNANGETIKTYHATCVQEGQVVFTITDWTETGAVYAYFMTENGCVSATVEATLSESFHLGQALYAGQTDSEAWSVAKVNGALNLNEQGQIYNDATYSWRNNYWIAAEKRAWQGYDYSFTCNMDLADIESIAIPYTFVKKCNCGGQDWFYIVNGGVLLGGFSCQDQASTTYTGTITITKQQLESCTSNTFYIFYGMGCSSANAGHYSDTLELGQMTVVRGVMGTLENVVFFNTEDYPTYTVND